MNYIIETLEEFKSLLSEVSDKRIICIPVMSDTKLHYMYDYLSVMYIKVLDGHQYILGFNHSETLSLPYECLHELFQSCKEAFIYDLKVILQYCSYKNVYDLDLVTYFIKNKSIDDEEFNTNVHEYFYSKFYKLSNINYIIPITKHFEKFESICNEYELMIQTFNVTEPFIWYNIIYRQLSKIENAGIYVTDEFKTYFPHAYIKDNIVYTEYNMYTTTGRASNRFDGVNYAALNKESGVRKCLVSRFNNNGVLVQLDYEAYHIRLLANLSGYNLDSNVNAHEYLGKYYFNTDNLTEEQYKQSKNLSFQQIYGKIRKEYLHIPLFKSIDEYTKLLWSKMNIYGYVTTPVYKRKLHKEFFTELNPQKLLNYMLQATEMEENMLVLTNYFKSKLVTESRIVLYTYDSFLFDFHINDISKFKEIKNIFEQNGKYPCTLQVGKNYDELITINTR